MTVNKAFNTLYGDYKGQIRRPTFDINFINDKGEMDETQFTVSKGFKFAKKELSEFFADFCKDNNFKCNSVTSIILVDDN